MYSKPKLTRIGTFRDITRGGSLFQSGDTTTGWFSALVNHITGPQSS